MTSNLRLLPGLTSRMSNLWSSHLVVRGPSGTRLSSTVIVDSEGGDEGLVVAGSGDAPPARWCGAGGGQLITPVSTAIGNDRLPPTTTTVNAIASVLRQWLKRRLFHPIDWKRLQTPW